MVIHLLRAILGFDLSVDALARNSSGRIGSIERNESMFALPSKLVSEMLKVAREDGALFRKTPTEIYGNRFVENLEKSGFVNERALERGVTRSSTNSVTRTGSGIKYR
ncbi:MAG: hypothetical protein WCH75_17560 [Candidatus Binatia bacterium]